MLRALHTRLAAALLVLLLVTGTLSIGSTLVTTRFHRLEAEQRLNRDLAAHIVAMKQEKLLADDGSTDREGLSELFSWLMAVNPRLECYLLDSAGRVTAYDPSLGELIERVLENLLENALRFTPETGSVTVKLDPDAPNGRVVVCVADTGCGIPEDEQKQVFACYYRVGAEPLQEECSQLFNRLVWLIEAQEGETPNRSSFPTYSCNL